MPSIVAGLLGFGVEQTLGWRIALFVRVLVMLVMAYSYARCTHDPPQSNVADIRAAGSEPEGKAITYGGCFCVEIFVHNIAASYYVDQFGLTITSAGLAAGTSGLIALFGLAMGGIFSDRIAAKKASMVAPRCCSC